MSEDQIPEIGDRLPAAEVVRKGEEIDNGVYEVEYGNCTVRAELEYAVITEVSE